MTRLKYDKLMESFKQIHSSNENLKKNVKSVQELTKDIRSMESEKEQLLVKLSDVKRRVSTMHEYDARSHFIHRVNRYLITL